MKRRILLCLLLCALSTGSLAQARPIGVRVREDVMRTFREKRVDSGYPQAAIKAGIHGLVELQIKISQAGQVQNIEVISGDPVLASSAIEAVKQWHYKPYLLNGVAMTVFTKVTLRYKLSSGQGIVIDAPLRTSPAS